MYVNLSACTTENLTHLRRLDGCPAEADGVTPVGAAELPVLDEEAAAAAGSAVEGNDGLLRYILACLSPAEQFRLIGVSKRWDALLLEEIRMDTQPGGIVSPAALAFVLRRAGTSVRTLDVTSPACSRLNGADVLAALQPTPSSPPHPFLRSLVTWRPPPFGELDPTPHRSLLFSAREAQRLCAACPNLANASIRVRAEWFALSPAVLGSLSALFARGSCIHLVADGLALGSMLCADGAEEMAAGFPEFPSLISLDLSDNNLCTRGARAVIRGVLAPNAATLKWLNLSANHLGGTDGETMAMALAGPCRLSHLDLRYNMLGSSGVAALALALPAAPELRVLLLCSNRGGDESAASLARALESPGTGLLTLGLGANGISNAGAKALARALLGRIGASSSADTACCSPTAQQQQPRLRELILSANCIQSEGLRALESAREGDPSLQIDASFNDGM